MQTLANQPSTDAGKAGDLPSAVKSIMISGTAPARWRPMADALVTELAARGLRARVADLADVQDGGVAAGTLCLGFVDLPEHVISGEPPAGFEIATWERSARALLAAAQAQPGAWRLIDTNEAAREPASLALQVAAWTGAAGVRAVEGQPLATDPLATWLVRSLAPLRQLRDELHASTTALGEAEPATTSASWPTLVGEYLRLRQAMAAARRDADQVRVELSDALRGNAGQRDEIAALHKRAGDAEQSLQLVILQLHQVQEELETTFLQKEELGKRLADANEALEAARKATAVARQEVTELTGCRDERDLLLQQLHQVQEELEAAFIQKAAPGGRSAEATEASRMQREPTPGSQSDASLLLAECRQERDLLLLQLHQVQEELELQFLQWQAADSGQAVHGHAAPSEPAARLRMLNSVAATPHRHVDVTIDNLRIGDRRCEEYTLRFVEHLGHPGLLFWHPSGRSVGLTAWEANGQEAGRDFMLVVPASAGGRDFLARLGTQDWLFVNALAHCFKVAAAAMPELEAWKAAAARLVRELESLPARLRYDRLVVDDASAGGAVGIAFEQARFGAQPLGTVCLTWQQSSRRLVWTAPADVGDVPLVSWPVTEAGELAAEYELPVGGAAEIPDGRERWARLQPADKELILAVLDALPAAASAASGGTALTMSAASLERDARALHRQTRRQESRRRVSALVKRLLPIH